MTTDTTETTAPTGPCACGCGTAATGPAGDTESRTPTGGAPEPVEASGCGPDCACGNAT